MEAVWQIVALGLLGAVLAALLKKHTPELALLLALALTTSLFVNWQLHGVGIAKTADYLCGELELSLIHI